MSKLTIIACAHNEPKYDRSFVTSMLAQTSQDFHAVVFHNGHNSSMEEWVQEQSKQRESANVQFRESPIDKGNWGTANRQRAIEECTTDYIIQTSAQDYWLPQAVEYIQKGLEEGPDILIWNSINHLIAPCQVLNCELAWSKIDWGNFCIKTSIAKQIKIQQEQYCADWLFVKEGMDAGLIKTAHKINAILTIHN